MEKKELYCIHDKKSNVYNGFMIFDNLADAIRSFQMSCEKNEVFKKWPEDFQFVKVTEIKYTDGEFLINGYKNEATVIAEAKDFVKPAQPPEDGKKNN